MMNRRNKPNRGLGLAAGTVRMVRENLSALFNHAVRIKLIDVSPVLGSIPPQKEPSCGNSLTVEEAWAFISVCDRTWYGDAFKFNLQTGLRPGELMGLIWDDIDPAGKTIRIERACKWFPDGSRTLGKVKRPRSNRLIELTDEQLLFLGEHREKLRMHVAKKMKSGKWRDEPEVSRWLTRRRTGLLHLYQDPGLIFPSTTGQLPSYYSPHWAFKFLLRSAGLSGDRLNLRWYDLRHTQATILLTFGVPRHEVAERLGHTVKVLDDVYSHTLPGRQRKAASLFQGLIPLNVQAPGCHDDILKHVKKTAASYKEDLEAALIKLVGTSCEADRHNRDFIPTSKVALEH